LELFPVEAGQPPAPQVTGASASHWARYALAASRRRWPLVAAVFLAGAVAVLTYYRLSTPLYRVETLVLVQQHGFGTLGRGFAQEEAPNRSVFDLIHRRENLLALLKHAGVQLPAAGDPAGLAQLAWRGLARLTGGSSAPQDPLDALVRRLDKALVVTTVDGTITIAVDWPRADQAYRLVDGALQNFLEDRRFQELTMADEAISLLQPRVAALREQMDRVSEEVRRAAAEGEASRRAERPTMVSVLGDLSDELVQLKGSIDSKERAIGDVEEMRRRRQTELQTQLDTQRAIYSEIHPTIVSLRQDIAGLSKDSPQIAVLREEVRKLRQDYARKLIQDPRRTTSHPVAAAPAYRVPASGLVEENELVRQARFQYQQMADRLNLAQLERDAAGVALKYRYVVSWPAELPVNPTSPSAPKVFGLGLVASILLALLTATALELRQGRVVARWQVLQLLGLPILSGQGRA
jgi:uncharacterized protein involved in exopolysaccharide biosynthesis